MKVFMESFVTIVAFAYVFIGNLIMLKYAKETGDYPPAVVQVVGMLTWPIILVWAAALAFKEVSEERKRMK